MVSLRLAFMGSPDFSIPALSALLNAGHQVVAVYAQPPRPAGRGQKERLCPVHAFAVERGIEVRTPKSLRSEEEQARFAELELDVCVVAAYGLILPAAVLQAPRLGCINVHASLLPRWRGAAPIQRAILAGDEKSGVTIMQMDEGLDTGDMLLTGEADIGPETTAQQLHDELANLGGALIVKALDKAAAGTLDAMPQPDEGATYAAKLEKSEGRIDWSKSAAELDRLVRALNPWPGVWFVLNGENIKVKAAEPAEGSGRPGDILDDGLLVACGDGALRLASLQRPGKGALAADIFLRGFPLAPGIRLD